MTQVAQHLVNSLILGGTYALLGIGLTLIFGIMNVVNFTHGALYTVGAYAMYIAAVSFGLDFFLAFPVAIVAGLLLGALIEWTLLRPLRGADIDTTMLVMIGAGIALQSAILWIFTGVAKAIPSPFPSVATPFTCSLAGWTGAPPQTLLAAPPIPICIGPAAPNALDPLCTPGRFDRP